MCVRMEEGGLAKVARRMNGGRGRSSWRCWAERKRKDAPRAGASACGDKLGGRPQLPLALCEAMTIVICLARLPCSFRQAGRPPRLLFDKEQDNSCCFKLLWGFLWTDEGMTQFKTGSTAGRYLLACCRLEGRLHGLVHVAGEQQFAHGRRLSTLHRPVLGLSRLLLKSDDRPQTPCCSSSS